MTFTTLIKSRKVTMLLRITFIKSYSREIKLKFSFKSKASISSFDINTALIISPHSYNSYNYNTGFIISMSKSTHSM